MNSHPVDEALALFYGGELSRAEGARVAAHVDQCPKCRATVAEFAYSAGMLRRAFPDVAAEDLHAVRESVLAAVRERRKSWPFVWIGAALATATIALFMVAIWFRPKPLAPPAIARVPIAQTPPESVALAPVLSAIAPVHHHRRRAHAGIRAITLVARGNEPPQLKILTADPNVVIYLQPSGASQTQ